MGIAMIARGALVLLAAFAMLVFLETGTAHAQIPGLLPGASAPEPEAVQPATDTADQARALLEVLRDDTARAALLGELERLADGTAPAPDDGAVAAAPDGPLEPVERPTLGEQLAMLTAQSIDRLERTALNFQNGLNATWRRLSLLWSPRASALLEPLESLAVLVLLTVVIYAATRHFVRRIFKVVAPYFEKFGVAGRVVLGIIALVMDLLALFLAYAIGNATVYSTGGYTNGQNLVQTLYLNAFLIVETIKVALAALIRPKRANIRVLPFSDAGARYWTKRASGQASLLGYGLMLVVPVVSDTLSFFTGRAIAVVVMALSVLWAMVLVIKHRKTPGEWLARRAAAHGGADTTLRLTKALVSIWHWPALIHLSVVFVLAVGANTRVGPFMLDTLEVVGVIVAGMLAISLVGFIARRGLTMPEAISEPLPLLEGRINGFLTSVLGALRLLIFMATIAAAFHVSGRANMPLLLTAMFGPNFGTALASVGVIVLVAFLLWLALVSWVDYRLNPSRAVAATAREATLLTLLRNAVTIALVVITTMVSLSELGIDIAPLLASAGVLGLAIGFGSQRLVQDIITGIFIQFENAFNVGDVVTVGGTTGVVEKLTIRSVSLRDLDGVFHIIPFSSVDMVSNFMRDYSFHVAVIGIAYRESIDEAKALMFEAFDDLRDMPEFSRVIIGPLDWHGVTELGDSAVNLRARIRTRPGSQWSVGRAYNEAVKRRFDAAGVEIPFPHMTLWFGEDKSGGAPPLRMARSAPGKAAIVREAGTPISTTTFGQDAPSDPEDGRG